MKRDGLGLTLLATLALSAAAIAEPGSATPDPEALEASRAAPVAAASPKSDDAPFGFTRWQSDGPLSIHSDELEALQKEGNRTLIFRKNVRVTQGELAIRCDRLEAYYPAKSSQPDRLVATGDVYLAQGSQEAWCDETVYNRRGEMLVCRGSARFRDGDNMLRGSEIEIDLARETVNVRGGAEIVIQAEPPVEGDS